MEFDIKEIYEKNIKASITKEILSDLPEWFGMEDSTQEYITES